MELQKDRDCLLYTSCYFTIVMNAGQDKMGKMHKK